MLPCLGQPGMQVVGALWGQATEKVCAGEGWLGFSGKPEETRRPAFFSNGGCRVHLRTG